MWKNRILYFNYNKIDGDNIKIKWVIRKRLHGLRIVLIQFSPHQIDLVKLSNP